MNRNQKIIQTSIFGIIVNILLVAFKATVGFLAHSIAIVLDAVNNLSDAVSSIITIIGTKLAAKKPDREHPYGHGRIEYIASTMIAAIVLIAGFTSLKESAQKIIHPEEADYFTASLVVIMVAVVVKFLFGKYVKKVGNEIHSQSLIASGTDAFMDSILSFSTLIAALISLIWHISLEGYLGLVISVIIIKSSVEMLKETVNSMIGTRVDTQLTNRLKERILKIKEVQGVYDLTLHNYGPMNMIGSAHIQVRDEMTAREIHILSREIMTTIYKEFGIILTIGIYAANDKGEYAEIKKELDRIIASHKEILQIHGFYAHNNLISFDLIIDFKAEKPEEIKNEVIQQIKEKYPEFTYHVILDTDMSD